MKHSIDSKKVGVFLLLIAVFLLPGCRPPNSYSIALQDRETINRGDIVYLDNEPVATVESIFPSPDGNEAYAQVRLNSKEHERDFVQGIKRKKYQNKILLVSPAESADSKPLSPGRMINFENESKLPPLPPMNQIIVFMVVFIVLIGVITYFVKTTIAFARVIIAVLCSFFLANLTKPFLTPYFVIFLDIIKTPNVPKDPSESLTFWQFITQSADKVILYFQEGNIDASSATFAFSALAYYLLISTLLKRLTSNRKVLGKYVEVPKNQANAT